MPQVRVIILRTAGTNCDIETAHAFTLAGAAPELVHINSLTKKEKDLQDYHILAIPGGFTYGDDIASGKILANELKFRIGGPIQKFIKSGRLIIGICNGFQVLVKAGLLPDFAQDAQSIEATLTLNDSDKFEDRWVHLKTSGKRCIWTKGITGPIELPVAHGEGKFIPKDPKTLKRLKDEGMIALQYVDSRGGIASYPDCPNGSVDRIAGICDTTGRIFGLMPHPERHISPYQHPGWTRRKKTTVGDGFAVFNNGVRYAAKYI